MTDLERCRAEIEHAKQQLRDGHPDVRGLLMALRDWAEEARLIEEERLEELITNESANHR
jgi:hypothetical protein